MPAGDIRPGLIPHAVVRGVLLAVGVFNALSAIGGGIGLLTPGSMGLPLRLLEGSVFTSYLWPAIVLIVVVGGTQALAVVADLLRWRTALFWAAFAGFAMVLWIFVELAIVQGFSVLHGIYFATGIVQLALVLALLGVLPGLVREARPR